MRNLQRALRSACIALDIPPQVLMEGSIKTIMLMPYNRYNGIGLPELFYLRLSNLFAVPTRSEV